MSDTDILAELRGHLERAKEWAHPDNMPAKPGEWSCIGSTLAAVNEGNVGLALTRWDDLLDTPSFPRLSAEAENWVAPAVTVAPTIEQRTKKRKAARLAFFCAELGRRRPWCCFIDWENGTECRRLARWEAWWNEDGEPYTNTHACDAHLGKLLPDDGREVHVGAMEVQAIDALADLVAEG